MDRFYAERKLSWTAMDRIGPDRLQLGTEQTGFMRNGTRLAPDQTGPQRYIPDIYMAASQIKW